MPIGYPPSVFVSSTCYDLSQVRRDLKDFIESLGYVPVISEHAAFPVNPQADNVANCMRAVRDRADLFVLIIGGRYGTQTSGGLSITNQEYMEAKAKGVPIYIFVAKNILHTLPIWQANPSADFSQTVDTEKLFQFVQKLREESGHWIFSFEHAAEITSTLRMQWALLFTDTLQDRERLRSAKLSPQLKSLPSACLRILIERGRLWEYRLFTSVMRWEIGKHSSLRLDVRYGLRLGTTRSLEGAASVMDWLGARISELQILVDSTNKIVESALKEALGEPGEPGNPDLLAYTAHRFGVVYQRVLSWTHDFATVATHSEFNRVVELVKSFSQNFIEELEIFPDRIDEAMDEAEKALASGDTYKGEISLTLKISSTEALDQEFNRLWNLVTSGQLQ